MKPQKADCCFCEQKIDMLEDGWGVTENLDTGDMKLYHLECAELNDYKIAKVVE